jgi:hypothetical protein
MAGLRMAGLRIGSGWEEWIRMRAIEGGGLGGRNGLGWIGDGLRIQAIEGGIRREYMHQYRSRVYSSSRVSGAGPRIIPG